MLNTEYIIAQKNTLYISPRGSYKNDSLKDEIRYVNKCYVVKFKCDISHNFFQRKRFSNTWQKEEYSLLDRTYYSVINV